MRFDASDIEDLRPLISLVVAETRDRQQADESRFDGYIGLTEARAAALLDVERYVLRDCRLRGEIAASRVGKRVVYEISELKKFLRRKRIS